MFVAVGRIGRPHGIRGEVTIEVLTDDPGARFAVGSVLDTDPTDAGPLTVAGVRYSGHIPLVAFEGVTDRNGAEALRGTILQVDTSELPPLGDADEYYDHQLIGLQAIGADGTTLGAVTGILHAPASPVLTVRRPDGTDELVPFVAAIVTAVDLAAGAVTIDPPDGMFA